MPIYEYLCQDCDLLIEIIRPIKDADMPVLCKRCHGARVRRIPSLFNAVGNQASQSSQGSACSGCSTHTCSACKR